MSKSNPNPKELYWASELGQLHQKIRRFSNMKELSAAFNLTPEAKELELKRKAAEQFFNEETDKMVEIDKKYDEECTAHNKRIEEYQINVMKNEVEVFNKFEQGYNK